MIRNITVNDAGQIADIYNYYVAHTIITFEEKKLTVAETEKRMTEIRGKGFPYIVYEENERILGFACLNNFRSRAAYDITLETSIYLDKNETGKGIGTILYTGLIERAGEMNIHSLVGVISLPNEKSRELHRKFDFKFIGNLRESGMKFGRLIDVEFWQLIL
ncbi:MAG: GNAT family N-acetyltransferase [Prevotellaceae bacterium]|jgi:phosphinothricin acetyltransferase|nr:GNAT family N-acetyltransferase [Prevotellaceae bacterium]